MSSTLLHLPSLSTSRQAVICVRAYGIIFSLAALVLFRPNSSTSIPTTSLELFAAVLEYGVGFAALGVVMVVTAFSSFERKAGWWPNAEQSALRALLAVCGFVGVVHWLVAGQQTYRIDVYQSPKDEAAGVPPVARFYPLEQMSRLCTQATAFALFCSIFHCSNAISWSVQLNLVFMHGLALAAFTSAPATTQYIALVTIAWLMIALNIVILLLLRKSALATLRQQRHLSFLLNSTRITARPGLFVARWLVPVYIVIVVASSGIRTATYQGALPPPIGASARSFLDAFVLLLVGMIVSDVVWQGNKAAARELQSQKERALVAEGETAAQRVFMRYIFHELRVPLNGIALASEELGNNKHLGKEGMGDISVISSSVASMSKVRQVFG
jgi:hypothetical protein